MYTVQDIHVHVHVYSMGQDTYSTCTLSRAYTVGRRTHTCTVGLEHIHVYSMGQDTYSTCTCTLSRAYTVGHRTHTCTCTLHVHSRTCTCRSATNIHFCFRVFRQQKSPKMAILRVHVHNGHVQCTCNIHCTCTHVYCMHMFEYQN